jgi:zinc/manganese transport system ATP-binding protein
MGRRGLGLGLNMSPRIQPAITFNDLTLGYDRHPAVHHITGEVARGELLALIGPNGAGKSTLLKGLMGELAPFGGSIDRDGLKRCDIAYLPQQIEIDRSFPISVFDCVATGLWREIGVWRGFNAKRKAVVEVALSALGLLDLSDRVVGSLSGGQFQRVLFARLLLQDAQLILLDEPFRAIDEKTIADLVALIEQWHTEGRTVIAALHDLEQVRAHFPSTLILAREVVAWGETQKVLKRANLAKSRQLTQAWNEEAAVCERDEQERPREIA